MSKVGLKCRKVHHHTVGNNSLIINPEDGAPFPPPSAGVHLTHHGRAWHAMSSMAGPPSYKCVLAL